ncbi:FRG domain-containing protein [Leptolyngbya sp. NK1-12]|uniref:FRG domain-containing protein n=1 Tax=Leptolyngbya sp. NK1-12 TaxID=2547451 RepID=A0AA97AQJ6_9CYAN|nr:FRG domain-containing protein [Leptolyngbya sp. NK1-12]WNZ23658.1 FRG domain-containing protein [Leptolyngbya sp. NK1-12]
MQEVTVNTTAELITTIGAINRGKRSLYRGQRRDLPLLPKIARLLTYLPILEAEQAMLEDFKLRSIPCLEQLPENDWEWLAVMQHHGLATRLLDWSVNPLAALWFAVNRPASDQAGVIWLYQPDREDYATVSQQTSPFQVDRILLIKPKIVSARIGAQLGWFTIHPFDPAQAQFLGLNSSPAHLPRLTKITIPPACFAQIRFELDRLGINASTLFPDLEGLCAHIEWSYSRLPDETVEAWQKYFVLPSQLG